MTIDWPEYTPTTPTSGPIETGNLNFKLSTNWLGYETIVKSEYFTWQIVPLVPVQVLGGLSMM